MTRKESNILLFSITLCWACAYILLRLCRRICLLMQTLSVFAAVLLVINLLVSGCIIGWLAIQHDRKVPGNQAASSILPEEMKTGAKDILYIGTNDKDTYTQLIPTEEARDMVNAICAKYA